MTRIALSLLIAFAVVQFANAADPSEPKRYHARGVLRQYAAATAQATIAHETIPGYMAAMTMSFRVSEPKEMAQLKPGDAVTFDLCVTAKDAWIEHVAGTGMSVLLQPAPVSILHELQPGDVVPDLELTSAQSEKVRLSDFRGKVVALTFIYTRCPLPTYCPLVTSRFADAQQILSRLGNNDRWHFISVSIDPTHDTPNILSAAAKNIGADPKRWTYATTSTDELKNFGRNVGLEFTESPQGISHNLRTIVIDPAGHLAHVFKGNTWSAQELAAEVRAASRR